MGQWYEGLLKKDIQGWISTVLVSEDNVQSDQIRMFTGAVIIMSRSNASYYHCHKCHWLPLCSGAGNLTVDIIRGGDMTSQPP